MLHNLYCVCDSRAGFLAPMVDVNDQTAIRNFGFAMKNQALYSAFPDDYSLFRVGSYDEESGLLQPLERPVFLCSARDFIKVEEVHDNVSDSVYEK